MIHKRILVINDDPVVRASCIGMLKNQGYFVETTASTKEGLEHTMRKDYDCTLIDLNMLDTNGREIFRMAEKNRIGMSVLMITGYSTIETAVEAIRLGVSGYLCTPLNQEEVVDAVDNSLLCVRKENNKKKKNRKVLNFFEKLLDMGMKGKF